MHEADQATVAPFLVLPLLLQLLYTSDIGGYIAMGADERLLQLTGGLLFRFSVADGSTCDGLLPAFMLRSCFAGE